MAAPHPSWVIYLDGDTAKVAHLMGNDKPKNNSHGTICTLNKLNQDAVLRVEMWHSCFDNTAAPDTWALDRLPTGMRYITDADQRLLDKADDVARQFKTPANIAAYLATNPNARDLAPALFRQEWLDTYTPPEPVNDYCDHLAMLLATLHEQATGNHFLNCSRTTATHVEVPPFYLEDILYPNAWTELPPSREETA